MLTPAMEKVIKQREAHCLNFHYGDSDSDDCSSESSGTEHMPVYRVKTTTGRSGTRIGLRNKPGARRQSCDTYSSHSDSIEFVNTRLISSTKRRQPPNRAPPRNSKLSSRQISNGMLVCFLSDVINALMFHQVEFFPLLSGVIAARKKSHAISKKYLRSCPSLRNTTLQG